MPESSRRAVMMMLEVVTVAVFAVLVATGKIAG
ncbi:hypothetical protein EV189_2071 [Motilibacter rhizosphaerae]|uniref:Uncharacterized protein n=1 Tax=Motilibacter rhizosphaerae TaxID=598652 RepID=A0A4Q7NT55_9ACTN|nr:hypothetical protein EV189_2071 [Motilibacter rhizosphaerae]